MTSSTDTNFTSGAIPTFGDGVKIDATTNKASGGGGGDTQENGGVANDVTLMLKQMIANGVSPEEIMKAAQGVVSDKQKTEISDEMRKANLTPSEDKIASIAQAKEMVANFGNTLKQTQEQRKDEQLEQDGGNKIAEREVAARAVTEEEIVKEAKAVATRRAVEENPQSTMEKAAARDDVVQKGAEKVVKNTLKQNGIESGKDTAIPEEVKAMAMAAVAGLGNLNSKDLGETGVALTRGREQLAQAKPGTQQNQAGMAQAFT